MRGRRRDAASWLTTILGMIWLGLFPLMCDFTYTHLTRSKFEIMVVLSGVTLLTGIACLLMEKRFERRGLARWLLLGYFAWVILSARFGAMTGHLNNEDELTVWAGSGRFEGLQTQLCYLVIFLGLSLSPPKRKPLILAAAAGLTAYCVIVGLQYAGYNPLSLFPNGRSIRTNYEFQGTLGNIDMVCGYLLLAVPLLLGGWIFGRGWSSWLALLAGSAGMLLLLMIEVQCGVIGLGILLVMIAGLMAARPDCRSRGWAVLGLAGLCLSGRLLTGLPWLDGTQELVFPVAVTPVRLAPGAAGLALILWGLLRAGRPGKAVPIAAVVGTIALLAVIVVLAVTLAPVPEHAGGLYELHEVLNGRPNDAYGSWRLGVWRHTLEAAQGRLLWGGGPDTFYPMMRIHLAREGAALGENFDNPHNMYLAILSNNGLPALLLYLGGLLAALARCVRRRDGMGVVLAWMIVCYCAQGFFTFSLCIVTPMFWAVLGLACAPLNERMIDQCTAPLRSASAPGTR